MERYARRYAQAAKASDRIPLANDFFAYLLQIDYIDEPVAFPASAHIDSVDVNVWYYLAEWYYGEGEYPKAVDYCPNNTKEYRAGIRFGVTTDTQDITGKVLATCDTPVPRNMEIKLMERFTGDLMQTPPMYSAVQVDGQRLYELARKGIEIDRKPRPIKIFSLKFDHFDEQTAVMTVSCSKGTYIRTLIHDMGVELGTGAIMTSLERTRSGNFTTRDCYRIGEIREASEKGGKDAVEKLLMPIDIIFNSLPAARLTEQQTGMFMNGVVLDIDRINLDRDEGPYRILSAKGKVIAIGRRGENGCRKQGCGQRCDCFSGLCRRVRA